jgi:hypothetical protein
MKTLKEVTASIGLLFLLTLSVVTLATEPRLAGQGPAVAANPAPTPEQIRSLVARVVENQHHNDQVIEEYERLEHVTAHKHGENSDIVTERTDRVLPSGTGNMRLQTAQSNPPVSPEANRRQLEYAVNTLDRFLHPNERTKQDLAKFEKRRRDRSELVDAAEKAFRVTWAGRETRGSLTCAKLLLDPDPNYKPTSYLAATFEHMHGILWVDESQGQVARIEADITSDITFVGGIVAKVYHGGRIVMEQSEMDPGVWLPTLYTYDVDGRKFLLGFGLHERTDVTHYRHLGPPRESIEIIRSELNNLEAENPAQ